MRAKERLLRELDALSNRDILKVYDLVLTLKEQDETKEVKSTKNYLRVRDALKGCSGSLTDDIAEERDERI